MNIQVISVLCVFALFIGINGKPIHKDGKIIQKRAGHSILLRKLIPKHFSIEISGNIHQYVKQIGQKKRSKRSTMPSVEGMGRERQIDEMKEFSGSDRNHHDNDDQMNDSIGYSSVKTVINRKHKANTQKQQSNGANSEEYRDYAFDTTDTDQFNEDDDLLQRYYVGPARHQRRAANDDYASFSDIMRVVGGQGERDNRFEKRLHYGYDDSFLNDEAANDLDNDIDDFNSEYDEYDDY